MVSGIIDDCVRLHIICSGGITGFLDLHKVDKKATLESEAASGKFQVPFRHVHFNIKTTVASQETARRKNVHHINTQCSAQHEKRSARLARELSVQVVGVLRQRHRIHALVEH